MTKSIVHASAFQGHPHSKYQRKIVGVVHHEAARIDPIS